MPGPAFDPTGAVRFDMKRGAASDARGERLVLLPASAIEALERSTPSAMAHLGAEVGRACGQRVAANLGGEPGVRGATLEEVVTHLAGELALAGLGAVELERWGRAMVLVLSHPGVNSDAFVGAALAGALGAAAGRQVAVLPLGREGVAARFFVGTELTVNKARSLVSQGTSWPEVLGQIQKVVAE
jgi:hypothetical protein